METNFKFHHEDSDLSDNSAYRTMIGKLLYLTITIPYLSFAVQQLSQFLDKPTILHWKAMHKTLRYIKAVPGQGILFLSKNNPLLTAFSNSY